MRYPFATLAALALATPAAAQNEDPFAPARAIVADIGKIVTPNGVQETFEVTLGGARQVVNVRGTDRDNPILLFVHGGPGAVEMPFAWAFQRPWEDVFTVVQYDQRGAGRSYPLNDPAALAPTMTPDRYRDDAIELIEHLQKRFGKKKVVLLGHSWGSVVGLSVAIKRPDLLYAYVGVGQGIDFREGEKLGMAWTRAKALADGNTEAVAAIDALAPYPQGDFTIAKADGWRKYAMPYGSLMYNKPDLKLYFQTPLLSPEYGPDDVKAWGRGSAFSVSTVWPQLADMSFKPIRKLEIPVVFLLGRHDYTTPSPIAAAWLDTLEAPSKSLVWLEHSAHMPMVEEPGHFFAALVREVLPLAQSPD